MAVPPSLPNLDPNDMKWVRWVTDQVQQHGNETTRLQTNLSSVAQQHATSAAAVAATTQQVGEIIKIEQPTGPPQIPTTPLLSTDHGTVTIRWDGQVHANVNYVTVAGDDSGSVQDPYAGFSHVNVQRATAVDGTFNNIGTHIGIAGSIVDTNVVVGQTYWYRLITTDNLGVNSMPSSVASIVVVGVDLGTLASDVKSAIQAAKDAGDAGLAAGQAGQQAAADATAAASSASGQAATALSAAQTAQQRADQAYTAAENATGTTQVYIGTTQPADTTGQLLWIDTTNGANTPKKYNGSTWVVITDKAATDAATAAANAAAAASAAQTTANTAVTNAQNAQNTANTALTAANGKNKSYYQTTQPSTSGNTAGDMWWDTDDGYKLYVWDGSAWTASAFGVNALGANSVTATQLANGTVDGTKLANAVNTSITNAQTTANNAATTAAGKSTVTFSSSAPTGSTSVLWINTLNNANTPMSWNGTTWVAITDKVATDAASAAAAANTAAQTAQTAANTAQTTANGKNTVSYSTAAPVNTYTGRAGDVWFTQDASGNVTGQYVWSGSVWTAQQLTNSVIATLDAAKITTGTLAAARIGANTVTANQMVAGTITAASGIIADAAITNAKIAALDAGKITTGTLDANRIGANSIAASQMIAGTITAASGILADASVVTAKIADLAVNTAKIADLAVSNAKIADLDANKIQAGTIVAGKLSSNSVVTNNIVAGAIDTNRLAAGAITADKIALGTPSPAGSPIDRVPSALTNQAYWAGVVSGTTKISAGGGSSLYTATANGIQAAPSTTGYGPLWITNTFALPDSRKITVSSSGNFTGTSGTGQVVLRWSAGASIIGYQIMNAPGAYTYTAPSNATAYDVFLETKSPGVGGGLFSSVHVFEVIGQNEANGQSAQLSPAGMQLFDSNGNLALDLTTNAAQFLNIYDNTGSEPQSVASIDNTGVGSFTSVTTDDGYDINGVLLSDPADPYSLLNAQPNGGTWPSTVPLLDRLGRGCIYDVSWTRQDGTSIASPTTLRRIAQDQFTLEDGRQYQINVMTGGMQANNNGNSTNVYLEFQLNTVPNTSITAGQAIMRAISYGNNTSGTNNYKGNYFSFPPVVWTASASTTTIDYDNRLLPANVPIYWQLNWNLSSAPTFTVTINEFGYARGVSIIDIGSAYLTRPNGNDAMPQTTDVTTTGSSSGSTSGGTTATSKTVTFTAKSSRTWNNGGSTIVTGSSQYTNGASMYYGTGVTDMGSWFGQFRTAGGTAMSSVLAGKTVTAATLTVKNAYTYSSSGSTVKFGTGSMDTAPASIGVPTNNTWNATFSPGSTKSMSLSSTIRGGLSSGGVQSFVLGVGSGKAGVYSYFNGATQSSPPKLTVTYH